MKDIPKEFYEVCPTCSRRIKKYEECDIYGYKYRMYCSCGQAVNTNLDYIPEKNTDPEIYKYKGFFQVRFK